MSAVPAWWREGQDREKQNRRSRSQERNRAASNGGKLQPGSGSSWRARGDVRTEDDLEALKYTDALSYRLDVRDWRVIEADARSQGREPVLIIRFAEHNLTLRVEREE